MSRVFTVGRARPRKPIQCGRCSEPITTGQPYRWTKPRYGAKLIRCMKRECAFRPTDLSSAKTARIDEAIEDAQDTIDIAESIEDIQQALQDVADVAREVADEYREASDNWAGGTGNEEYSNKADACESFADSLESWTFSGEDDEDEIRSLAREEGEDPDNAWSDALVDMRNEANNALSETDW